MNHPLMNRWTLLFVALLVAGPLWLWASRAPVVAQLESQSPEPAVGRPAPDFVLTTLDGASFSLSELRGTPVVINFWATWCGPCQREMPTLRAAATRFEGEVVFAGVDQGETPAVINNFFAANNLAINFPIPLDPTGEVADRYNVKGLPTTFFVDADGVIRQLWVGEMNSVILAEGIATIWP